MTENSTSRFSPPRPSLGRQLSDHKTVSCLNEETAEESPSFHHLSRNNSPHSHCADDILSPETLLHDTTFSPDTSPLLPRSPESIWSFSPPRTPCHPPLLYHCISSLHRDGNIYSIAVSRGVVYTGSSSACIRAWEPLNSCEKGSIHASTGGVQAIVGHGHLLFTSHKDHKIRVWSILANSGNFSPRKVTTLPRTSPLRFLISRNSSLQHKETVSCMAYSHAGGILYTGSWDKTVKVWRLSDRKCLDSFAAHADNINDMVINQDGFLFTCSSDGTVKMWSRVCGETFHTLMMTLCFHPIPIYALAITAATTLKRTFLYSGSSGGCINFWEGQVSGGYSHGGCIQAHHFAVLCLSTLENMVISGSADSTIKIWRREEGKVKHECLAVLEGHKGPVKCLASYMEDTTVKGFLVFSASLDRTFKVWRVKVLPETKKSHLGCADEDKKSEELSSLPVLSPSWVQQLQRG